VIVDHLYKQPVLSIVEGTTQQMTTRPAQNEQKYDEKPDQKPIQPKKSMPKPNLNCSVEKLIKK
jgi:hypothetical protein